MPTGPQGLLQRVEHEVGSHRRRGAPADDPTHEHIDDEGDVNEALPCRDRRSSWRTQSCGIPSLQPILALID